MGEGILQGLPSAYLGTGSNLLTKKQPIVALNTEIYTDLQYCKELHKKHLSA